MRETLDADHPRRAATSSSRAPARRRCASVRSSPARRRSRTEGGLDHGISGAAALRNIRGQSSCLEREAAAGPCGCSTSDAPQEDRDDRSAAHPPLPRPGGRRLAGRRPAAGGRRRSWCRVWSTGASRWSTETWPTAASTATTRSTAHSSTRWAPGEAATSRPSGGGCPATVASSGCASTSSSRACSANGPAGDALTAPAPGPGAACCASSSSHPPAGAAWEVALHGRGGLTDLGLREGPGATRATAVAPAAARLLARAAARRGRPELHLRHHRGRLRRLGSVRWWRLRRIRRRRRGRGRRRLLGRRGADGRDATDEPDDRPRDLGRLLQQHHVPGVRDDDVLDVLSPPPEPLDHSSLCSLGIILSLSPVSTSVGTRRSGSRAPVWSRPAIAG